MPDGAPQVRPGSSFGGSRDAGSLVARLRERVAHEEFDYQVLVDCLQDYERPRDKITDLLRKGTIVRAKKGLYVFGALYRRGPVSREVLANLIYGPSHISLDYALQHYGLIPEGVEAVTSVTCGRSRSFGTPFGAFTYRHVKLEALQIGVDRLVLEDGRAYLIASREKALADKLVCERGTGIRTQAQLETHLVDSLRVDGESLRCLDSRRLDEIAVQIRSRQVRLLSRLVARLQRRAARRA